MRFQFKTSYNQDIRLFRDRVDGSWYGLLGIAVLVLPFLMDEYSVGEITWVFIYALCGVSLMALADRARLDRHPRQRDRRPVDGRQPGDLQVDGFRLFGGADGPGGRAVRPQDRLPRARHLLDPAVDPVPAAGDRGRAGVAARRGVRR